MKEELHTYLNHQPLARERKNKDIGIVNLLRKNYPILESIPKETLVSVVQDYNTYDRYWRKILEEDETVRGSDYEDREILSQEKQLELGYSPNYKNDLKILNTL